MILEIDFNSDEAIYVQLRNQIIMGIACAEFADGESLPSVRQLAQVLGVNMHTVNKAYAILREEGYLKLDRRYINTTKHFILRCNPLVFFLCNMIIYHWILRCRILVLPWHTLHNSWKILKRTILDINL